MKIIKFGKDCRAATAIEYGLIIALIALAIMGSLRTLGGTTDGMWANIAADVIAGFNRS